VSILRVATDGPPAFTGFVRDITERKEAEAALCEAHAELERRVVERTEQLSRTLARLQQEITERIQAERALEEARRSEQAHFRELDQLKSDLVAFVAHELRQPATVIAGYAELLLDERPEDLASLAPEYLSVIVSESNRLTRLMNAFLDISRIDADRPLELYIEPCDVRETVEQAVLLHQGADDRSTILTHFDPEVSTVRADRDKLLEVLLNLFSNAAKYSPSGSTMEVRVRAREAGIQFEVADHGMGISEEAMEELFTPFYRTQDARQKKILGTGLGLYLCKHLIAAHGGHIWVESEPGRGSTFFFTLPR
jgi:signal transduction histidine kinase